MPLFAGNFTSTLFKERLQKCMFKNYVISYGFLIHYEQSKQVVWYYMYTLFYLFKKLFRHLTLSFYNKLW